MAYDQHAVYGEAQEPFVTVESSDHSSVTSGRNHGHDDDDDVIVLSPSDASNPPRTNTSWSAAANSSAMAIDHMYSSSSVTAISEPDFPQMPLLTFPRGEPPAPHGADSINLGSSRRRPRFTDLTPLFTQVRDFLSVVDGNQDTAQSGWESPLPGSSLASLLSPPRPTTPPRSTSYTPNDTEPFGFLYSHIRNNNASAADRRSTQKSHKKSSTVTRGEISESESEIEIVGYEKPFEDRTPIALSSGSSDVEMIEIEQHTNEKKKRRKKSRWDDPNDSYYRDLNNIFHSRPQAHSSHSERKHSRSSSCDRSRSGSCRRKQQDESCSDEEHHKKRSSNEKTPPRSPQKHHKSKSTSPADRDRLPVIHDGVSAPSRKKKKYNRSRSDPRDHSEFPYTTYRNRSRSPQKKFHERSQGADQRVVNTEKAKRSKSPKEPESPKNIRRHSIEKDSYKAEDKDFRPKLHSKKLDSASTKDSKTRPDSETFRTERKKKKISSEERISLKGRSSYSILDVEKYRAKQLKKKHQSDGSRITISKSRSRSRSRTRSTDSRRSNEYKHKKYRRESRQDSRSPERITHAQSRKWHRSRSRSKSRSGRGSRLPRWQSERSDSQARSESSECCIVRTEKPPRSSHRKSRRSRSKSPRYKSKRSRSRSSDCQIFISRSRRRLRASSESSVEFVVAKPARRHGKHRKHKKHKRHRYYVIDDSDSNHSGHGIEILDIFPAKRHKKKSSRDKYEKNDGKRFKKHHSGHKKSSKKHRSSVDRERSQVSSGADDMRDRSASVECVGVNTDNVPPPVGVEVAIHVPNSSPLDLSLLNVPEATMPIAEYENTDQSYTNELDRSCEVTSSNCNDVMTSLTSYKSTPFDQFVVDGEVIAYPMHGEGFQESKPSQSQSGDHSPGGKQRHTVLDTEDNNTIGKTYN